MKPWLKTSTESVAENRQARIAEGRKASELEGLMEVQYLVESGGWAAHGFSWQARMLGWGRGKLTRALVRWRASGRLHHDWQDAETGGQLANPLANTLADSTEPVNEGIVEQERTARGQLADSSRTAREPRARSLLEKESKKEKETSSRASKPAQPGYQEVVQAITEVFPEGYPLVFKGRDNDGGRVKRWLQAAGATQDPERTAAAVARIKQALTLYVEACERGEVFPKGEPATTRHFDRDLSKWLQLAANPQQGQPVDRRQEAAAWWGVLQRMARGGEVVRSAEDIARLMGREVSPTAERCWAAMQQSGCLLSQLQRMKDFDTEQARKRFLDSYEAGRPVLRAIGGGQ